MTSRCAIAFAAALGAAACGAPQRPPPHTDVRAEIRDAELAERARHHDVARAKYEHAIAGAHDAASLGFARGRFGETLATWGEYREAIAQLEAAVAATPEDEAAWYDLGIVRAHESNEAGALDALVHSKRLAPRDWRPRMALAGFHWKLATACLVAGRPSCTNEIEAARGEYRNMLELELPDRLREKVKWALDQLAKPNAGLRPDVVAAPAPAS